MAGSLKRFGVSVTPKHVALEIDVGEVEKRGVSTGEAREGYVQHGGSVCRDQGHLALVVVVIERAVFEGVGLLGHALRVELAAEDVRKVGGEGVGRGDRLRGRVRGEVYGRSIELEVGP